MNIQEIIKIEDKDVSRLLYSHDNGFTRHAVIVTPSGFACLLNESYCFQRSTHERMMKLYGIDFKNMNCITFDLHYNKLNR